MRRLGIVLLLMSLGQAARAQFPQIGIGVAPVQFGLLPARTQMMAAYCGSLLDDPPTFQDRYVPVRGAGTVTTGEGDSLDLRQAVEAGVVVVRGRGPMDPPRRDRGLWIDLYAVNTGARPLRVDVRPGAVFQPVGHPGEPPEAERLATVLGDAGLAGTDLACLTTWVATGSTRSDLEHALARLLTDAEMRGVEGALAAAESPGTVRDGIGEYASRYSRALAALGPRVARRERPVLFPSGLAATLNVTRAPDGGAVARASASAGRELYYGASVAADASGSWRVQLVSLKSGRPVPGLPAFTLSAPPPAEGSPESR